jgi:hypothetical protein
MPPIDRRTLLLSLIAFTVLLALVWAEPRPIDDLFIALAGGRDVLAGHLGTPDDWSFTTEGRVWLNQNWGSHVLFYATHAAAGPTGLLTLKALLLLAAATCLALGARARGVGWAEALVAAAVAFAASRSYVDLRPNLVGVVFASGLLWILTCAASRPVWIWLAAALIGLWANAHGSFVFGLGLMAVWTLALGVAVPRVLPAALGALATALALAAFANPFGLENLTHPFVVGMSAAWRTVAEWLPLFSADPAAAGSKWEICTLAGGFVLLLLTRLMAPRRSRTATPVGVAPQGMRGLAWFDAAVLIAVLVMALRARRFVPLAAIAVAAPLATQLAWWHRRLDTAWPTRLLAAGLTVAVAIAAPPVLRRYRADNPVFAGLGTFERMVDAPTFPARPAEFLRANGLGGHTYAAWEWEGFLRWNDVPVTVLIGGRAQQVYDEATLQLHKDLRTGATTAREALAARQVGLAILPLTAPYSVPLGQLVYREETPWAYLYCDGRHVVLIDTSRPELAATVAALEANTLQYPTPAIAATSRMMYLASPKIGAELTAVRTAAEEAARLAPTALAYAVIGDVALADRSSSAATRTYLAGERQRLAALAAAEGESFALAQARLAVARTEAALVARTVDPEGVRRTRDELALRVHDMRTMLRTWAYGWNPEVF